MTERLIDADLAILVTVGDEVTLLAREVQAARKLRADLLARHSRDGGCPACRGDYPCRDRQLIQEADDE